MTPLHVTADASTANGRIDTDAVTDPYAGVDSVQVLASALRGVSNDTLVSALAQLRGHQVNDDSARSGGVRNAAAAPNLTTSYNNTVTPQLVKRLAALAFAAITLLEPISTQISERLLSPRTELGEKLDEVLREQSVTQATILSLAKWIVEVERARELGLSMPVPPAPVRLILAQDDVARSTGQ